MTTAYHLAGKPTTVGFFYEAPMMVSRQRARITEGLKILFLKFIDDRCMTHASALSFSSLLSVIPFLAILFAILKALDVHSVLAPVILSSVAAGSHEIITRILGYIANTKVASLGFVGLAALLLSVMATLDNLEDAFNQICGIERGKAYHHKLRDYLIVIFSIPLLIALAASVTTSLQHQGVIKWFFRLPLFGSVLLALFKLVPYLSIWIALLCCYRFVPNTHISFRNALAGSVIAGTLWQFAHWCFVHFQFGIARYNAIYGTLSLLPAFMIWILTGWCIVLAGMQIVWLLQISDTSAQTDDTNTDNEEVEYNAPAG